MLSFRPSRTDGRSNADLVYDLVFGKQPGTMFSKNEMLSALDVGSDFKHAPQALPSIVAKVNKRLLKDSCRTLRAVPRIGYRVANAAEHSEIADRHRLGGDRKYRKAMDTLRHTVMDEMTPQEQERHKASLTVMEHHEHQIAGLNRRVSDLENMVRRFSGPNANASGAA